MRFPPLPSPWEPGWAFPLHGRVLTCTRSRERVPGEIRIPNYQSHPNYVMQYTDHAHYRWDLMSLFEIPRHIKRILNEPAHGYLEAFPRASAGLQWILDGTEKKYEHEAACDEYTDWLHLHGATHALRPPNEWGRARAAGVAEYLAALHLTGRRLYDVVGLAFDPRALQRRLCPLLMDWEGGLSPRALPCPSLDEVITFYRGLDRTLQQHAPFAPREPHPYPPDLMPAETDGSSIARTAAHIMARPAVPLGARPPQTAHVHTPTLVGTRQASATASSSGAPARP